MTQSKPPATEQNTGGKNPKDDSSRLPTPADCNGTALNDRPPTSDTPATSSDTAKSDQDFTTGSRDRAEEMADQFATQVACVTAALGRGFLRLTARLREEAEDIWAEAQDIRRGDNK
jgi:hypothetical protein